MADDQSLAQFVELAQVGNYRDANEYLRRGYMLLAIKDRAVARPKPQSKEYFIERRATFIVGRAANVESFTLPSAVPAEAAAIDGVST